MPSEDQIAPSATAPRTPARREASRFRWAASNAVDVNRSRDRIAPQTQSPWKTNTASRDGRSIGAVTERPIVVPADRPTGAVTARPTVAPTTRPIEAVTARPFEVPTERPTGAVTNRPNGDVTARPIVVPTARPAVAPRERPTVAATPRRIVDPTVSPLIARACQHARPDAIHRLAMMFRRGNPRDRVPRPVHRVHRARLGSRPHPRDRAAHARRGPLALRPHSSRWEPFPALRPDGHPAASTRRRPFSRLWESRGERVFS